MSNPYAAPASRITADDTVAPLIDGQSFRIEGDTLICRKQVDLSDFCFYLGEDVSQKIIVKQKKLKAVDDRSFVARLLKATPFLFVLPLFFPRSFSLTMSLAVAGLFVCALLYKQLAPGVKIQCIMSSDGEALKYRSIRKNAPRDSLVCVVLYVVFLFIGEMVISRLGIRPHFLWVVIPSTLSALTVQLLKKWAKAPDVKWGPPRAVNLGEGMYRLLDLPTNLVRAYAAKKLDAEESLVKS